MTARLMKRATLWVIGVLFISGLVWRFPLFHVVPIGESQTSEQPGTFNPEAIAEEFWNGALRESFDDAADAEAVMDAIRESPRTARDSFGRTVGLSRSYYFFLRGKGTILSIGPTNIGVALDGDAASSPPSVPDFLLPTGLLFGSAVRDATGLLNSSDYANSQHFNEIATELNRLVEIEVLPKLKDGAVIGKRMHFVGCAEVVSEARDLRPLKVVPIHVEFEK